MRLGQTALVQLELGTNHDHRAAGIIHALAQQVAAEAAFLAFEHIAQRFQLAAAAAGKRFAALRVVDQGVDRFLQHALFVAHDHIRRAQLEQALETVVAVDHPAVEIVQVGGGKATTIQLHHRAQVGRDDRQDGQHHPFRAVAGAAEGFDHFQALGGFLALLLALGGAHLVPQLFGQLIQVEAARIS